jgi:hypothetical protein
MSLAFDQGARDASLAMHPNNLKKLAARVANAGWAALAKQGC